MEKIFKHIIFGCCCSLLFGACQTVEQLSIDYMLPAEVTFPSTLKRMGVVNNMPATPDNKAILEDEENSPKGPNEVARKTTYFNGDAVITTEALANALVQANYFDEVVICDSALRTHDAFPRVSTLSKDEVINLTQGLDVDFLVALENIQVRARRKISYQPEIEAYEGTLDVKVYPIVKIYLPERTRPMTTVQSVDSIFWEEYGGSMAAVNHRLIDDEEMLKQASEFAGSVPAKQLLPYWTQGERYFFSGGSVNMRDAAVYVKEKNWSKAIELWQQEYNRKKVKQKMQAAYNLALGYEMQDSIAVAAEWALKAQNAAYEVDKVEEKKNRGSIAAWEIPNYIETSRYVTELNKRRKGLSRLDAQMKRFQ
ncbi:MAG: DUF6340 family protein [Mediterranea sp.]|jgi:hypothetical protein|nr:DUF6340 family protein [Mediterranea sp.]